MDLLIIQIHEKLPQNCIYKIALIASVFAGKNNYCHHVLLAEKIRPLIIELRHADEYSFNKIFKTSFNKNECKKICNIISKLKYMLDTKLKMLLTELQYEDKACFTYDNKARSELYFPVIKCFSGGYGKKVFRGYHFEYDGYFKKTFFNKENKGKYNESDIKNFILLLDKMITVLKNMKTSPACKGLDLPQHKKEWDKIEKNINKLYLTGIDLCNNFI